VAYVTEKRGVFYAVIYEGQNPVTGRERDAGTDATIDAPPTNSPTNSPNGTHASATPVRR
jgi:hypothetical protein